MTTCANEAHNLYPGNCPTCNPQGYQALLAKAPVGQEQEPTFEDARAQQAARDRQTPVQEGYSDSY